MFDSLLVVAGSLRNTVEDGVVTGFQFQVRQGDYRGSILSLYNGCYCCVDGVQYPRAVQRFEINGKGPRTLEELKRCRDEHWDFDDAGTVWVTKPGGLTPGHHKLDYQQSILAAYFYLPTDEEWIRNPPEPGNGAGCGKTDYIVSFDLELAE